MIHEPHPRSRPAVITNFTRGVCLSHFSKSRKTKQISRENSDRYWRDCGSGRGDHLWHQSCVNFFLENCQKCFHTPLLNKLWLNRLTKKSTRQLSSMIHSARPIYSHASSEHWFLLFCFSRIEKWGRTHVRTYRRTDNMCENTSISKDK